MKFFLNPKRAENPLKALVNSPEFQWIEGYRINPPTEWDCLFIEGFHELFREIPKVECEYILFHLDMFLARCMEEGKPYFIDYRPDDFDISEVSQYPTLSLAILNQEQACPDFAFLSEFYTNIFFEACKSMQLNTVLIGGNFGDACVWSRAGRISNTVFAQSLPRYTHPNIRFDTPHKVFQNAIIVPEITQGSTVDSDSDSNKLPAWLCFPPKRIVAPMGDYDIENKLADYLSDDRKSPVWFKEEIEHRIFESGDSRKILVPMLSSTYSILQPTIDYTSF